MWRRFECVNSILGLCFTKCIIWFLVDELPVKPQKNATSINSTWSTVSQNGPMVSMAYCAIFSTHFLFRVVYFKAIQYENWVYTFKSRSHVTKNGHYPGVGEWWERVRVTLRYHWKVRKIQDHLKRFSTVPQIIKFPENHTNILPIYHYRLSFDDSFKKSDQD